MNKKIIIVSISFIFIVCAIFGVIAYRNYNIEQDRTSGECNYKEVKPGEHGYRQAIEYEDGKRYQGGCP